MRRALPSAPGFGEIEVVYCGTGWFSVLDYIAARLPAWARLRFRRFDQSLAADLRSAHVLLPSNCTLDGATLSQLPQLCFIQQPAVGLDGIDLRTAQQLGIPVCNAPGLSGQAVAEAALLLMLALARRLPEAQVALFRAEIGSPVGFELGGKVLGTIGCGRTGGRLGEIATGLGMTVLTVDSTSVATEWEALLSRADFVSIHCPLDQTTYGLIGRWAFERMKRGVFLINCARGPIVDRVALLEALAAGKVAGIGIDTHWQEPWDPQDPLLKDPRVVALPHIGGSTDESFRALADLIADNLERLRTGAPLRNRVV